MTTQLPGIRPDSWIRSMSGELVEKSMIQPFVPDPIKVVDGQKVISYGTSSYGYDARVAGEFLLFRDTYGTHIDPHGFDERNFQKIETTDYTLLPPHSFALARTVEYFRIPRDVLVICLGKSTYARCGLIVNVTPLEPEWEGHVTIEISNTAPVPVRVYANQGICQFLFLGAPEICRTSYADRGGKYQGQQGIVLPKV
jgi:dCTP deaminase